MKTILIFAALIFVGLGISARVSLATEDITRTQIIERARTGLGHAYHWGKSNWSTDGTNVGACMSDDPDGCPDCVNVGEYGSDCSGFVAKVWAIPEEVPFERNSHPFETSTMVSDSAYWDIIPVDEVGQGDAVAWNNPIIRKNGTVGQAGHIFIVNRALTNTSFNVLQAEGCAFGINEKNRGIGSNAVGLRRVQLLDADCSQETCGGHGRHHSDCSCDCDIGYAGDRCERCDDGYAGFPNCAESSCPEPRGELRCGSNARFAFAHNPNDESYECLSSDESFSNQASFRFAPYGQGKATIRVQSDGPVAAGLMRNECNVEGECSQDDGGELTFPYVAGETFFVAIETAEPDVQIEVVCDEPELPWVGSWCLDESDCGTAGKFECYIPDGQEEGMCTMKCFSEWDKVREKDRYLCPDLPYRSPTFCVADPQKPERGICVPTADRNNAYCEEVASSNPVTVPRFKGDDTRQVCMPGQAPCSMAFTGLVQDDGTGLPIPGATVKYVSSAGEGMTYTDQFGTFEMSGVPCDNVTVSIIATGFLPADFVVDVESIDNFQRSFFLNAIGTLCPFSASAFSTQLLDGVSNEPLMGATVQVHLGPNAPQGEVVKELTSDENGEISFDVDGGYYTLTASAEGYQSSAPVSVSICDVTVPLPIYLLPAPESEFALRFVLNWEHPDDLDLHLQLPSGREVFFEECAGSLTEYPFAKLDVDHQYADGPESITVKAFDPGPYTLFVHNFSAENDGASANWTETGAVVDVYDAGNNRIGQFFPPFSEGNYWDVLTLDGGFMALGTQSLSDVRSDRANPYDEYDELCRP